MVHLGVNIDHIATLRQQRKGFFPDPVYAAQVAEEAGADGIVAHLREDRRHIQDQDIQRLRKTLRTRLALEMAATDEMVAIALQVQPPRVCLVPERRQELTTEGGLDVMAHRRRLQKIIQRLSEKNIFVSLFVDPDSDQLTCSQSLGADAVELHTGAYASAAEGPARGRALGQLQQAGELAHKLKLHLHAGHGLDYQNVQPVARIPGMEELNIGYSIVSRALFVGLSQAVKEMKEAIK